MTISIIIKSLNEEANIARAIESALRAVAPFGGEVVLADSGSRDLTIEIARRYPILIVQLADPEEACCGLGPQLGFQHCNGDFIYILDGDMELQADFVATAMRMLADDPALAGVGGYIREMNQANLAFKARAKRGASQRSEVAREVDCLGGGGLYRRASLQSVGYMSDRNLHSLEEYDLGKRLKLKGWRMHILPDHAADHYSYTLSTAALLLHKLRGGFFLGQGDMLRAAAASGYLRQVFGDVRAIRYSLAVLAFWSLVTALAIIAHVLVLGFGPALVFGMALLALAVVVAAVARNHRGLVSGLNSVFIWHVSAVGLIAGLLRHRTPPTTPIADVVTHDAVTNLANYRAAAAE